MKLDQKETKSFSPRMANSDTNLDISVLSTNCRSFNGQTSTNPSDSIYSSPREELIIPPSSHLPHHPEKHHQSNQPQPLIIDQNISVKKNPGNATKIFISSPEKTRQSLN